MADINILVRRIAKKATYTIGKLYIDGAYFCDTIEDKDRGLKSTMSLSQISAKKVKGQTAIPTGTYNVTLSYSPKFANRPWATKYKGFLPLINNVPGFDRILIHVGNTERDTEGCLLLGKNTVVGKVTQSTATFQTFMDKYFFPATTRKKTVSITIQ